jgi:hypothetical protein
MPLLSVGSPRILGEVSSDMNVVARNPNCLRHRWRVAAVLATAVLFAGCPRVLYLDYQPSVSIKGSGPVRVDSFAYAGHPTGLMKQKELESGKKDPEALYLAQDIGGFFTIALKRELVFAGYDLKPDAARLVSGTIEHFFLDYVGEQDQRFQIRVTFNVSRLNAAGFTWSCRSEQQQVKDWTKSGLLIERGVRDCIQEFIKNAQQAGAL